MPTSVTTTMTTTTTTSSDSDNITTITNLATSAGLPEDRYPSTLEEADVVDRILSEALENLTLDEHEKVLFDLHGVSSTPRPEEQDPELLQAKMEELQGILEKSPDNEAYLEARRINSRFVESYAKMYLIAKRFHVQQAASVMLLYFTVKKELFGSTSLGREIRQSDLTPIALRALETGMMQTSTVRDSAGRTVLFMSSQYDAEGATLEDVCQAIFYYGMATLQDLETLRDGVVWVFYNLDNVTIAKEHMDPIYRVEKCLPPRISGCHYCFTDPGLRPFVSGMQLFLTDDDRPRTKQHLGCFTEIQESLQTYGIPVEAGLMNEDGTPALLWLQVWLLAQKNRENRKEALEQLDRIVVPRRFDVIIGKTSEARIHTGNRRAIHLCNMYFNEYEQASKYKKTEVAEKIVSIIRQSGGRFLKWDTAIGWVEETDEVVARKKIGHFLRYMRSKITKTKENTSKSKDSKSSALQSQPTRDADLAQTSGPESIPVTPPDSPQHEGP